MVSGLSFGGLWAFFRYPVLRYPTWSKLRKKKIKFKTTRHLKMMALIKGEMKLCKKRRMNKRFKIKDHLTQESTKQFNEITPSTPSLVTSIRG